MSETVEQGGREQRLADELRDAHSELRQLRSDSDQTINDQADSLRKTELQFQQLVSGISDYALYMLDREGIVSSWNPGAERIKGYTANEIIGQHFSIFYSEEDRASGMPERVLKTATEAGKYEAEAWRVRKDGTRFWASVLVDAIRDNAGNVIGFAKITRDMTEQRAMQEQLHQAQKMEAIGQLTGGVAHDFNNLLTVILGNLETLQRGAQLDGPRRQRAVEQATHAARRAAALTGKLLAFARRQPLEPKATDVNRMIAGMIDLVRRTLPESIGIETVLGAGLWRVEIDPHQLENALLNLAVNARDAMPDGGSLMIETSNTQIDAAYAGRHTDVRRGEYVMICITDTGTGMTKDTMAKAFDPFFTTKPVGQGTGLGLSQVFGFVKQSGGHLKLYSEIGQGTTVRIYLPRSLAEPDARETEERDEAPQAPRPGANETILVVEDDPDVRLFSTETLRELGFTVLEAHDGPTALRIIEQHREVKLLFTDVGLPGLNGRELVDLARQRRPGLAVLFTSGYARNAIVHQGRLDPGVELLPKPFTQLELGRRVRALIDSAVNQEEDSRVALIVEDEPLVRLFLADVLDEYGFHVVQAVSVQEALQLAEEHGALDVAFVDVGLPDGSGIDLAEKLRAGWPAMRIAIATGYGEQCLPNIDADPHVTYLAKPYDSPSIIDALTRLELLSTFS
jgi:PAS domain S-box-containing protein